MFFESFLKFQVFLQKKALRKQRSEDDDFIRKVKIDSGRVTRLDTSIVYGLRPLNYTKVHYIYNAIIFVMGHFTVFNYKI